MYNFVMFMPELGKFYLFILFDLIDTFMQGLGSHFRKYLLLNFTGELNVSLLKQVQQLDVCIAEQASF